jgi:hypothetical protein
MDADLADPPAQDIADEEARKLLEKALERYRKVIELQREEIELRREENELLARELERLSKRIDALKQPGDQDEKSMAPSPENPPAAEMPGSDDR